ncbi:hypothetical protein [Massilia sp. Leaf139]|uniref:hypothetical protein n=1 Tax=Massilia sp. Leaf139 TaxID=1736272 RepID=UPI0006F8538D|nr:hypothetical protein [Massilia sp. Leaf139]KQQ97430.1 hypothetical protein ASF77_05665 [Massilia sp. Leaf139]
MKAERIELAALAAVGVQRTPQEIATAAYLAEFAAVCESIAATPVEVRIERVQAVRNLLVRPADAEAVRAAFWLRMPLGVRTVAVMSAGLDKARAEDTLNKFDALERGLVWVALDKLVADLQTVKKCMNGGNSTPPHAVDKRAPMNGGLPKGVH